LHLLAVGKDDLGRVSLIAAGGHAFERLLHDADRFAQFLNAAHVTIEYVAFFAERHFKLKVVVSRIGRITAQIDVNTAAAEGWAACAKCDRVFGGDLRHTSGAHDPDRISSEQ